jgi:hypothetical protein
LDITIALTAGPGRVWGVNTNAIGNRRAVRVGAIERHGDRPAPRIGRGARGTFPEYGGGRGTRDLGEREHNDGDENCEAIAHGAETTPPPPRTTACLKNVASG